MLCIPIREAGIQLLWVPLHGLPCTHIILSCKSTALIINDDMSSDDVSHPLPWGYGPHSDSFLILILNAPLPNTELHHAVTNSLS